MYDLVVDLEVDVHGDRVRSNTLQQPEYSIRYRLSPYRLGH
jgi:hypothetical protein